MRNLKWSTMYWMQFFQLEIHNFLGTLWMHVLKSSSWNFPWNYIKCPFNQKCHPRMHQCILSAIKNVPVDFFAYLISKLSMSKEHWPFLYLSKTPIVEQNTITLYFCDQIKIINNFFTLFSYLMLHLNVFKKTKMKIHLLSFKLQYYLEGKNGTIYWKTNFAKIH